MSANTANWEIIKPLSTINIILNPSVETNTTGYTAVGGSIARDATQQKWGVYSLAVTPTAGTTDGVYYGTISLTSGTTYTFSVYGLWADSVPYKIYFASTAGAILEDITQFTGAGIWSRQEITYTEVSTTTRRVYVVKDSDASTAVFYIDGLQVEAQSAASTYCDGNQPGCSWNGVTHASTSERDGQSREGGEIVNLSTSTDFSGSLIVRQMPGTGMAPVQNIHTDLGLQSGGIFQRTRAIPRTFTLLCEISGSSVTDLHSKRQNLIDLIKPDVTDPQQSFLLRYTGITGITTQIHTHYDSGLELSEAWSNNEFFAIRLVSYDPYWEEEGDEAVSLNVSTTVAASSIIRRSSNGVWDDVDGGCNNAVYSLARGPGEIAYAGGDFTTSGSITTNRVAKWDGTAWSALGTGMDDSVHTVALGPDNTTLYAGGQFTTASGGAAAKIAKWDGSAWSAMDAGLTGGSAPVCNAIVVGNDGIVYAGGEFTTAGSVTVNNVAKWNGIDWSAMDSGTDEEVRDLVIDQGGNLYVVGEFDQVGAGPITSCYIAKWDGSAWVAIGGSGVQCTVDTGLVFTADIAPDNTLYVGGTFNLAGSGTNACRMASYDGSTWSNMGASPNGTVNFSAISEDGLLYLGGAFTQIGSLTSNYGAMWNGTAWYKPDFLLTGTITVGDLVETDQGDALFALRSVAYGTAGDVTASVPSTNITVSPTATTEVKPTIEITGPATGSGKVFQVSNYLTNDHVYFDDLTVGAGEKIILDFEDRKFTSLFRGNIINSIRPGSNVSSWKLLPTPNNNFVGILVDDNTASATMRWKKRHWSLDGGA